MSGRRWLVAGAILLSCMGGGAEGAERDAGPRWLSDWDEGRRAARESGRPIFVVFRCEN